MSSLSLLSTDEKSSTISEEEQNLNSYISQLGEKEKIAYEIAKNHLGTSFSLKKSIGYKEWLKKQNTNKDMK
jgi:hypothetical protein